MRFREVNNASEVSKYLVIILSKRLNSGNKVLWLVPGGSAMGIAVEAAKGLKEPGLENLTVSLSDERFGPMGHPNSNWQQLKEAGFSLPGANLVPVLKGEGFEETARNYNNFLKFYLESCDFRLGFIGIGPDGHTAGILPESAAVKSQKTALGYSGHDFKRLTVTGKAISRLNEVVSYAVGEAKWPVLKRLKNDVDPSQQPAQLLKQVEKLTIFTDYPNP